MNYISYAPLVLLTVATFSPPIFTSIVLLSFFFSEVLVANGYLKAELDKFKYLFLLVCAGFWGTYLANGVLYATFLTSTNLIKAATMTTVVCFGLAEVFFVTTSILIFLKLNKSKSKILDRMLPFCCITAFAVLIFVIGAIIDVTQVFTGNIGPKKSCAVWTLYWCSATVIIGAQTIYFREPSSVKSSKLSNTGGSAKNTSKKVTKNHSILDNARDTEETSLNEVPNIIVN